MSPDPLRILVVAANASARWGGEAVLPIHIFRGLREKGHDAWLCTGEETREELTALLGDDSRRVRYVADRDRHAMFRWLERHTPAALGTHPYYFASILATQLQLRRAARGLVRELGIQIVHQPTPVSPKTPSFLTGLGAPLVVGPMNGGMEYPRGFRFLESRVERVLRTTGRVIADLLNAVVRGKMEAAALVVANERTLHALPRGAPGRKIVLPENGVDVTSAFLSRDPDPAPAGRELRLAFVGRLVRWKGAEWLLEAFERASRRVPCRLTIVGDFKGESKRLAARVSELQLDGRVEVLGWQPQARCAEIIQASDALVLPSVFECGGAVVLEAMACAKPVIAVDWGGPADYLDPSCGVLVPASEPQRLVRDLEAAIVSLGRREVDVAEMGRKAREKILAEFTWPKKIDRMIDIYREVLAETPARGVAASGGALHEPERPAAEPRAAVSPDGG